MAATATRKLFVNLPVSDLDRSVAFFRALGFDFDPRFTDETATCMPIGEDAYAMLLLADRFRDFTTKDLCDTGSHVEALLAVSVDSREEVDRMHELALEHGGSPAGELQDHGFMVSRSFQDPDGHVWEVFWMDTAQAAG